MSDQLILANLEDEHLPESLPHTADCGHDCWISPASLGMVSNPDTPVETTCKKCIGGDLGMLRLMAEQGGGLLAPGARAEIVRALGEESAERMFKALRVRDA